jgi:hypothetical protein
MRREARASAGHDDHESLGNGGRNPKSSDRGWTPVVEMVFPQCSLEPSDCRLTLLAARLEARLGGLFSERSSQESAGSGDEAP